MYYILIAADQAGAVEVQLPPADAGSICIIFLLPRSIVLIFALKSTRDLRKGETPLLVL